MSCSGDAGEPTREIGTFAAFGEFEESPVSCESLGIDSGATLVKLCARDAMGELRFATWPSPSTDRLLSLARRLSPERIGIAGCGAADLSRRFGRPASRLVEFEAWARGARAMLEFGGQGGDVPYLLVSVGTGTSMLRVEGDRVERVGGTALGGGTLQGLGFALTGERGHRELIALASEGERARVDLLIGDLFEADGAPLMAEATASAFGKLGRSPGSGAEPKTNIRSPNTEMPIAGSESTGSTSTEVENTPRKQDLAASTIGLVAENIGLMATARASAAGVSRIVFGGSTLNDNPTLANIVRGIGLVTGFEAIVLPRGGHAGALGAMWLGS